MQARGAATGSLPLIVVNVVVHVIGLGLINESVVRVLSGARERRRFMSTFALVMGVAALLATVLHGIEAATWASAYLLLGALPNLGGEGSRTPVLKTINPKV